MAAIPVQITGILFDKKNKTSQVVTLIGEASVIGLQVGGGPIIPPERDPSLGIWHDPGGFNPNAPGEPWPPDEPPQKPPFEKKVGWTEETGWFVAFVPTGEHVTPSRK